MSERIRDTTRANIAKATARQIRTDRQQVNERTHGTNIGFTEPSVQTANIVGGAGSAISSFWEQDDSTTPDSMKALYDANMDGKNLFFEDQDRSIRTLHHALATGLDIKVPDGQYIYFSNVSDGLRISIKDDELQFWKRTTENGFTPGLRIDSLNIEDINALYFGDDNSLSREKIDRETGGGGGNRLDYYASQQHKFWTGASDATEKLLFSVGSDNSSNSVRVHSDASLNVYGNSYFNEDVVIGSTPTEHVAAFLAKIGSDLIPSLDVGYSLGSSDNEWEILWAGSANLGALDLNGELHTIGWRCGACRGWSQSYITWGYFTRYYLVLI